MKKLTIVIVVFLGLIIIPVWNANAVQIDLNDFFADPTVTVAPDGSSAILREDLFATAVVLSNDPLLGDPQVIFPGILSFEYNFIEGPVDNDDGFEAFVIDPATGGPLAGFEFFTTDSSFGVIEWDLPASLPNDLGLQFQLNAFSGDEGLDSTVTISNVSLSPIPEPATMILVGTGLFGLLGLGRKRFRN